ncbi:uncharacterized protein LOC106080593 [Stomoxys calcitrans]|uniref:uncharacterized protein LOC106080593 n=1 Tax=Stomoxys calcitrans TaxID=35570 RepID=UPI0027E2ADEB|nr:uncharacterized protein LOC106080593 [Stomoxys calcitrans]
MIKVILFLLTYITVLVAAGKYDWHPEDPNAIHRKCKGDNPLPSQTLDDLQKGQITDCPEMRSLLLCTAKGMNVYSSEKGFDPDRLAYSLYRASNRQCNRELVRECVEQYKNVEPEDAMIFKVIKCIVEQEWDKKYEGLAHPTWQGGCD